MRCKKLTTGCRGWLFSLLITSVTVNAQTSLTAGDLAITGVNMDDPDQVSLVFLVTVESGTELKFSDNGWKADNSWRSGEATQTWLAPRDYEAGEEIIVFLPDLLLSASGDQVIIFQNESDMLAAINNEGAAVWQADATSANTSALPQGLVNGETCVALDETDNLIYNRSLTSGSPAELRAAIHDFTNWSGSNTVAQSLSTAGFTISDQSLAVELSRWAAISQNGQVQLTWTTESEIENQGFILERSLRMSSFDGAPVYAQGPGAGGQDAVSPWQEIASFATHPDLLGQGSTSSRNGYNYIDKQVQVGQTYSYRLSDVDFRGNITRHPQISVLVRAMDRNVKPAEVALHPAYPNPFNPAVRFSFDLGMEVPQLDVRVYDIQGCLIKALARGSYAPGLYELSWDGTDEAGRDVASGVYLVQLRLQDQNHCQRVTLMR